ncbi:MAG: four helix bundle protein [Gemmatimonadales bacterium]
MGYGGGILVRRVPIRHVRSGWQRKTYRVNSHRRIKAWQCAQRLAVMVYEASSRFPMDERFGMTSQIRRAAVSVSSNVAEGHSRWGRGDKARFYQFAVSSLAETSSLLELAHELGYLNDESHKRIDELARQTGRLVWGLQRSQRPPT